MLHITLPVLQNMWSLCGKEHESGGQLRYTSDPSGKCVLKATQDLSETKQKTSVAFGQSLIAQHTADCHGSTVNVLYHTHPLPVVVPKGKLFGRYAPPSVADFFAHGVLGNYRNWKENKQMNIYLVMAVEGLYVYNILPAKFVEIAAQINNLFVEKTRSALEVINFNKGHVPHDIVQALKSDHYKNVANGYLEYVHDMNRDGDAYLLETGAFFETMQTDGDFIQNNAYQDALNEHGFMYNFYPAPFVDDILILSEQAPEQA